MEISTFCGYYPHLVEISTFPGYYPHFLYISIFRRNILFLWILSTFCRNIHVPWILSASHVCICISCRLSAFLGSIHVLWILPVFCMFYLSYFAHLEKVTGAVKKRFWNGLTRKGNFFTLVIRNKIEYFILINLRGIDSIIIMHMRNKEGLRWLIRRLSLK